jgi:hypothetical protein
MGAEGRTASGNPERMIEMADSAEDYQAKAAEALKQLAVATSDAERSRLKRAHGCFMKLATHGAEAAARAQVRPERIKPEKAAATPQRTESYFRT